MGNLGLDALVTLLPESHSRKEEIRTRIAKLANECGCNLGGVFFAAAMAAAVIYFLIAEGVGLGSVLVAAGLVFVTSIVGKFVGLYLARIRLLLLRRVLRARLASVGANRVHLH